MGQIRTPHTQQTKPTLCFLGGLEQVYGLTSTRQLLLEQGRFCL